MTGQGALRPEAAHRRVHQPGVGGGKVAIAEAHPLRGSRPPGLYNHIGGKSQVVDSLDALGLSQVGLHTVLAPAEERPGRRLAQRRPAGRLEAHHFCAQVGEEQAYVGADPGTCQIYDPDSREQSRLSFSGHHRRPLRQRLWPPGFTERTRRPGPRCLRRWRRDRRLAHPRTARRSGPGCWATCPRGGDSRCPT